MKLKITTIKATLLVMCFILKAAGTSFAQEKEQNKPVFQKLFIGISSGPSFNKEINTVVNTFSDLTIADKNSYSGSVEFGYYFSGSFGISTGFEYSSFGADLSLANYTNKFNTKDTENDTYERRITGSGIKETQDLSFLKVPLLLNLRLFPGKQFGLYFQAGIDYTLPLKKEYSSSGTFTYTGYYPAYNVTFQNLPAYGFPTNAAVSTKGQLELKSKSLEGIAGAGFQFFINNRFQIALGGVFTRSLSTITQYTSPESFQLSSDITGINSIMGGSSKVIAQTMGVRLSLRYYLK
jgi:hypothetical protein